jgi:hypothetical protein
MVRYDEERRVHGGGDVLPKELAVRRSSAGGRRWDIEKDQEFHTTLLEYRKEDDRHGWGVVRWCTACGSIRRVFA